MSRGKLKLRDKRRRERRRRGDDYQVLRRRFNKNFPDREVNIGPTGDEIKMSEVLEEFVRPYRDYIETKDEYRKLLMTAVLAWNVALMDQKDRATFIEKFLSALPKEIRNDGRGIIGELLVRKESIFSQYQRMILDFEVNDTGSGWHLMVLSTVEQEGGGGS